MSPGLRVGLTKYQKDFSDAGSEMQQLQVFSDLVVSSDRHNDPGSEWSSTCFCDVKWSCYVATVKHIFISVCERRLQCVKLYQQRGKSRSTCI